MPTPRRYESHAQRQAAYRQRVAEARTALPQPGSPPPRLPLSSAPGWHRWKALAQHALQSLQVVQEEMEAYYDLRSESWQASERGEDFTDRLAAVEEAVTALDGFAPQAKRRPGLEVARKAEHVDLKTGSE